MIQPAPTQKKTCGARLFPILLLLIAFPLLLGGTKAAAASKQRIAFGVYAHIPAAEVIDKMEPIRRYLESALNRAIGPTDLTIRVFPSYTEGIQALVLGQVDFVRFGPVSYVLAKRKNPGIRLLAMESNHGKKRFNGVLSVPVDSKIRSVADLKGRRIAFGDRKSTTGRYLAQAALVKAGVTAESLADFSYLKRHDKVALAVAAGRFDAGATNENTFNKYAGKKGLRPLIRFPCATKPWVARKGLPKDLSTALRSALLTLTKREILKPIKRTGLLPAHDRDFDMIRDAMILARAFHPQSLRFAAYASDNPTRIFSRMKPILQRLERQLDAEGWHVNIVPKIFPTYAEAINALAEGKADLARLGAASHIITLEKNPRVIPLAQEVYAYGPRQGFFVVSEKAPIRSLEELKGQRIAFGNRHSTVGRYLSQAELVKAGIHARNLTGAAYLGRHDRVALAVGRGEFAAGVIRKGVYNQYAEEKAGEGLRVIHRFPAPNYLWTAQADLEKGLPEILRQSLLEIPREDLPPSLKIVGFKPVDQEGLAPVAEAVRLSRRFDEAP